MFIESNEVKSRVFYQYKILVSLPDQLSFDSIAYANLSPRQIKNDVLRNIYNYLSESRDYIEITSANKKIIIRKEMALNNDINPCFRFKNENDEMVPFFVALPQLAIILPQKDSESPNEYCINELSLDDMKYYNKQILVNSKNLILNNSQMDINELM